MRVKQVASMNAKIISLCDYLHAEAVKTPKTETSWLILHV